MQTDDDPVQRNFGFCQILWKIEHFCLVTCKNDWVISSPEFYVRDHCSTTWRMFLKSKSWDVVEDGFLCASLKRLENDPGPEVVRANWKMSLLNGKANKYNFPEFEHNFARNVCCQVDLKSMKHVLSEFQPFAADVLYLQCQLIVSYNDHVKFTISTEQGIRTLSEDLYKLLSSTRVHDVELKIRDNCILLHKAILCARNSTLASIFDSEPETQSINLFSSELTDSPDAGIFHSSFTNLNAAQKIIAYLYSGNLDLVIGIPSVSIYEFALLFDVSEVIDYYIPDELIIHSSIDAEEFLFFWIITDFESSVNEDFILSPSLTEAASETIWRLRLLPKGEENYERYISIFAEIIDGIRSQDVCLEFGLMDLNHKISYYRRMQKSIRFGAILGFSDFVERDGLKDTPFLENGILRIIFKLRIFTSVPTSSCESSSISMVTADNQEEAFRLLSQDIACLFEEGKYSDVTVRCEDKIFKVHKCILASRSDMLCETLCGELRNRNEFSISYLTPEMFQLLLTYIYSGTVTDFTYDVICEVYKKAEHFRMYGLMNKCLQMFNAIES